MFAANKFNGNEEIISEIESYFRGKNDRSTKIISKDRRIERKLNFVRVFHESALIFQIR